MAFLVGVTSARGHPHLARQNPLAPLLRPQICWRWRG